MIPVLVASIVNRPDLLDRMLASVDVPVGRTLVIDNGRVGYRRDGVDVVAPPYGSMGWAGSLNFAIGQTPGAPWWLYANNDAWFEPGKLARLVERVQADPMAVHHDQFTVAAFTRPVIERIGLLDEWTYFPIYYEDTDYARRCSLAGIPVVQGDWCREGDTDGVEQASLTIRSDAALAAADGRTRAMNLAAYVEKWGGPPGRETLDTPWGSGLPLWATRPRPAEREERRW